MALVLLGVSDTGRERFVFLPFPSVNKNHFRLLMVLLLMILRLMVLLLLLLLRMFPMVLLLLLLLLLFLLLRCPIIGCGDNGGGLRGNIHTYAWAFRLQPSGCLL